MPEAVVEQEVCGKCGAEIREGTTFCYKCGGRVAQDEAVTDETNGSSPVRAAESKAALDDLAERLKGDLAETDPQEKLAKAAEERKKARVTQRKTREFVWEPRTDTPVGFFVSVAVVLVLAVVVVLVTIVWK